MAGRSSPTGCWSLARGAQPGSDQQLAFLNALCTSVLSTRHVATLADLLDRDPSELGLAGLQIDTDLRWRIVTALATAGEIDADGPATPFIDAEVQRDPTAAGKRHGAQAAAARPQPQVKEEAWTTVVEDDTLANITARSIIAGIAPPGQPSCSSRSPRATSRRSPESGHDDPAKSPRPW